MVWPHAIVRLRVLQLIRAPPRYASRNYWVALARDRRPVFTAHDEQAAAAALDEFADELLAKVRRSKN